MTESDPDAPRPDADTDDARPDADDAGRALKNVLVLAVADGQVAEEEKAYIGSLRDRLGIDAREFAHLCQSVRDGDRQIVLPHEPVEAERTLFALVGLAAADGKIAPVELRTLQRIAARLGIRPAQLETMIDQAGAPVELNDIQVVAMVEELYAHFAEWDDATRRAKLQAVGDLGRPAVKSLVRLLESYRKPEGTPDAVSLKVLVAEQLGCMGDSRPVYYLAQHVNLGDMDDEITSLALRAAAAEAIGKITGKGFTPDADGIAAVRQWWQGEGGKQYDYLMY